MREGHGELLAYDETRPDNVWCSVIPDSVLTEMLKCMLAQCVCVGSITRDRAGPPLGKAAEPSLPLAAQVLLPQPWMVGWPLRAPDHACSSRTHRQDQDTKPVELGMEAQRGQWVSCSQLCPRCLEQHLAHRRHSEHFCCMNRPHLRRWDRTRFSA